MYPEVCLLDQEGKNLLSFKRDSMNPMNEGFIELWSVMGNTSKQFIFRKRALKGKALDQLNALTKRGWKVIEQERQQAA
tara:strand:+ start:271 stop:507 length:237 start_codon:yes stop_codon:yes gene_type:complete